MPKEKEYLFVGFTPIDRDTRNEINVDGVFDFVVSGKDFLFKEFEVVNIRGSKCTELGLGDFRDIEYVINEYFNNGDAEGLKTFLALISADIKFVFKQPRMFGNSTIERIVLAFRNSDIRSGDFIYKIGVVKESDLKTHIVHGTQGV